MSQFMEVSLNKAKKAKEDLTPNLFRDFSVAVGGPVNSIHNERISTAEWGIVVGLERRPTAEENKKLPKEHMGVKIRYDVIGRIELH